MNDFLESEFSQYFEAAQRSEIQNKIEKGLISVNDCEVNALFERIAHLPHDSRIQWHKFPNISLQVARDKDGVAMQCKLDLIRSIRDFYQLGSKRGYLFEDWDADCVLQMDFDAFTEIGAHFFGTSGHKYFLSVEDEWLVNFTMEEHLHFSNRIKVG